MATLPKLDWQTVNIESMPPALAKLWKAYQAKMEAANTERAAFEKAAADVLHKAKAVPTGKQPRFGYRWGRLAIAYAEPSKSSSGKDVFSFE